MKGITIIAIGTHYGKWAAMLAASIRYRSEIPICLLHDKEATSHYTANCYALFSELKLLDKSYYHSFYKDESNTGIRTEVKAKLHLYELSPYSETVYIDAENLLTPNADIDDLFKSKFCIQSRGVVEAEKAHREFIHWADVRELVKQFGLKGKLYNVFSEYIYFKKNKKTEKIFQDALKVWDQLYGSQTVTSFNGAIPDEVCFMIAMNKNKVEQEVFCPTYWEHLEKKHLRAGMPELLQWPIYSMGGNQMSIEMNDFYNGVNSPVKIYCQRLGVIPFRAVNKKDVYAKRVTL